MSYHDDPSPRGEGMNALDKANAHLQNLALALISVSL
jgi:hypothetical protein